MNEKQMHKEDENFDNISLPAKGQYENCTFNNCDFAHQDLSGFTFINCTFNGCNLSLAKMGGTAFREVKFKDCKIIGVRFDHCKPFGLAFSFDGCQLGHSSFFKMKIKKTVFSNSHLQEADFTETDLTGAVFNNCNLLQTIFDNTILDNADFRSSYNYSIDPETNRMKKAKFSIAGISGLLAKYDIVIER